MIKRNVPKGKGAIVRIQPVLKRDYLPRLFYGRLPGPLHKSDERQQQGKEHRRTADPHQWIQDGTHGAGGILMKNDMQR